MFFSSFTTIIFICFDTTIRWGSHKGSASPLHDGLGDSLWDANPSTVQLLQDFAGTALLNSTGVQYFMHVEQR